MTVEVTKEPEGNWPLENCCICRSPTLYWYGTGERNVALCQWCADLVEPDELPTKAQWVEAERRSSTVSSFAAPW